MSETKITKRSLVFAAYKKLIEYKETVKPLGLLPYQYNAMGKIDTNKFMRWAYFHILDNYKQEVKNTTIERYLREFTSKSA